MTNYQQYAEYKDSGVEWLGEIPKEWISIRLKHLLLESLVYGANEAAEDDNPKNPRYIRITDMNSDGTLDPNTFRSLPLHIAENYLLKDGDILLARSGATVGKSFYYKSEFGISCFAGYLIRARPHRSKLDSKFAYWFFQSDSYWKYVAGSQIKATIQNVSAEKYGDLYLSLPAKIEEQTQIANFLDHETAKIDSLIEKQQQLIQLLKEKRQAVISHAVTKGLNPNVPMKDSGVEWLGQVPEHWDVKPLRYIGTCQNGINIGAEYFGSGSPFISYGDVYRNATLPENFDGLVRSSKNDKETYSLIRGDVLFTRTSETIEEIGFSSVCLKDIKDATFAGFLIRFRPLKSILLADFSKFYFRNLLLRAFFVKEMNLVTRASLSQELLRKLPVTIPSIQEQEEISNFLNQKEELFNKLISNSENQTHLLKERRTALISAAVTGKIDVRNWQNPTEAKMEFSA